MFLECFIWNSKYVQFCSSEFCSSEFCSGQIYPRTILLLSVLFLSVLFLCVKFCAVQFYAILFCSLPALKYSLMIGWCISQACLWDTGLQQSGQSQQGLFLSVFICFPIFLFTSIHVHVLVLNQGACNGYKWKQLLANANIQLQLLSSPPPLIAVSCMHLLSPLGRKYSFCKAVSLYASVNEVHTRYLV